MWPLKLIILWKMSHCSEDFNTQLCKFAKEIDRITFILRVNIGMWPLKLIILEKQGLFWGFQHTFMQLPRKIDGKTFILRSKARHVTPQIDHLGKMATLFWGFQHSFMGFYQGDRSGKTIILACNKCRHVTPQIWMHLAKTCPVLRVSTHIFGVSKEIDGKSIHFSE